MRRLESKSITDYIIKAEKISNALKEAGEVTFNCHGSQRITSKF